MVSREGKINKKYLEDVLCTQGQSSFVSSCNHTESNKMCCFCLPTLLQLLCDCCSLNTISCALLTSWPFEALIIVKNEAKLSQKGKKCI